MTEQSGGMAISSSSLLEFRRMIFEFGLRQHSNSVTGHPELCWQMSLRHRESRTTVYGRTPEETCNKAIQWLKEKGWWNAGDNDND